MNSDRSMRHQYLVTKILVLLFLTIASYGLSSQSELSFTRLTEGFTNCILKDKDGFIWIGTQDGLIRHDYIDFKNYRYDRNNPYSISNNWIWTIIEDENEDLWIGTFGGGLIKWDRSLDRFYSYENKLNPESDELKTTSVHSLKQLNDSILLVGTEAGLYSFNKFQERYTDQLSCPSNGCFINDIHTSDDGTIYFGTEEGLFYNRHGTTEFNKVDFTNNNNPTVYTIQGINHRIYFGTNDGLFLYNQRKNTVVNHFKLFQQPQAAVYDILLVNPDEWYVGTNNGLGHFNNDSYSWNRENQEDKNALYSGFIHCISLIGDNIAWAGSRKGIHQFSIELPEFKSLGSYLSFQGCSPTSLGMSEDFNQDIWIGTRNGLLYIDYSEDVNDWNLKCIQPSNQPEMKDGYVINITEDSSNNLWLAYRSNGISRLSFQNGKWIWKDFPKIENILGGEGVNQVIQDSDNRYWLATRGKGLMEFNPETEDVTIYNEEQGLSHSYIFRIFEDENGLLWLSTANGGLCSFDKESKRFKCYQPKGNMPDSISGRMVLSVNEYSDQRLLISTTSGLNIMNGDHTFQHINTLDGLANNVIYGALEDDNGDIWVSTNEGISRISILGNNIKTINYNKSQGLSSKEYNQHAFMEHSSGLFFFGGIDGITFFDPLKVEQRDIQPRLVFTDFRIFNRSVPIDPSQNLEISIPKSINELSEINLPYDQNSLELEFKNLNFSDPGLYSYAYKMEGLESDWNVVGSRNFATYPKMSPGKYVFNVNIINNNGETLQPGRSLEINISKPPWNTWWAKTIYTIIILGIIYGVIHFQTQKTKAIAIARENERNIFRKKMARDFHDEAGNKITMISLLTESASRKIKDGEVNKILAQLQDNTQELRLGMQDFIWVLDPAKDNLYDVLIRFKDFANTTFEHTDINFVMDPIYPEWERVEMTGNIRRHFLLIFKEAITNIIKYAQASLVEFGINKVTDGWEFTLKDNGVGFDEKNLKRINGLNNIKSRAEKINSKIFINSKLGVGTKINFQWKLPEN